MTNHIYVDRPAPFCIMRHDDPRRAFEREANVGRTFEQHMPLNPVGDDYDSVERDHHLDFIGGFK